MPSPTLREILRSRGVTRREFVKFCAATTAAPASSIPAPQVSIVK
jgi:Ni,Fe-hydrogenase I small subunit